LTPSETPPYNALRFSRAVFLTTITDGFNPEKAIHFPSRNGGHVIKLDIINNVAEKTGVPKMKAEVAVEALFDAMKDAMKRGERIELRGFGVFVVKPRKRGIGRNPRTGTEVAIPEGKTIRFKPGKELQS
jgi:DNA-binding protein HU-beta